MAKRLVVVVDMQKDFIDGVLGSAEAVKIVDNCVKRLEKAKADGDIVIFTRDTHGDDYMQTEEGKNLPIPHCIKRTDGWNIDPRLSGICDGASYIDKDAFGSRSLGLLAFDMCKLGDIDSIELFGLCTDICVISNAFLVKAFCPNIPIYVDAACSAGVTPESHDNAIRAMESCQIHILNKGNEPWR